MGVTFIGPNETSMFLLGDKIASTIIAQSAGVPCISWSGSGVDVVADAEGKVTSMEDATFARACVNTAEEAVEVAERVGYPIMIKASEGGGGKGVRKAKCRADIIPMFRQVADEVKGSPIFLMRLCDGARHIEVQVMSDKHRNVSILSGRDCSMQRRFQKIVEEGPPTAVKPETMRQMELAAVRPPLMPRVAPPHRAVHTRRAAARCGSTVRQHSTRALRSAVRDAVRCDAYCRRASRSWSTTPTRAPSSTSSSRRRASSSSSSSTRDCR
jgi:hypothetical protein